MSVRHSNNEFDFGPVPFWWWVGEALDKERLIWQLDRLREKGVLNAIVSYNHHGDGSPNRGEPPVFSREWWSLLREMLEACRERGMRLSFQDYTLLNPMLEEIGHGSEDMRGAGELREAHTLAAGGEEARVRMEGDGEVVEAWAYPWRDGRAWVEEAVELGGRVKDGELAWRAPEGAGEWLVSLSWCRPMPFDPLHPEAGARVIERFYAPFEREVGEHLSKTLPISFQDELDFGGVMPRWSRVLAAEFLARKGYELRPWLAALWHDLGPRSAKVRIDYADVVTRLLEQRYFIPVFEWHERHGLLFGNDNIGRGGIEAGRRAYGDAFRTMRWYSAPGTDDPALAGPRAFKGLKVNSSIAHLYGRPRVWNECFHSSGWGTAPADVVAALNADFALGATVVNLHGLYYSTFGGWWEWAPPDFHFRQPYWDDTQALSGYAARLCQLLSGGVHACDIAIVYPITALEGGLNARVDAAGGADVPVSERQAGKAGETLDAAEAAAFGLGRHFFEAGMDFDFVDFESLERAECAGGELRVAGEAYRALVLPWMSSVRFSTLETARRFVDAGGLVVFYGCKPTASERAGAEDAELEALVADLMTREPGSGRGAALYLESGYDRARRAVEVHAGLDFDAAGSGFQALHRREGGKDVYFVFNPAGAKVEAEAGFRTAGACARIDAWTGGSEALEATVRKGMTRMRLSLGGGEATLLVFDPLEAERPMRDRHERGAETGEFLPLAEVWECELEPTLDNRFGDFRRPPSAVCVGAEARRFRHAQEIEAGGEEAGWMRPGHDDTAWPEATASFGPRMWRLGPLSAGTDTAALERELAQADGINAADTVTVGGREHAWRPYEFSTRWGVENDPHLKDWASGPHGLKGEVPDEFIDLHTEEAGAVWLLWTAVEVDAARRAKLTAGSRSRYAVWLNGERVLTQDAELPPGRQSIWNLPHYRCEPQARNVALRAGANPLLLRFVQPAGQRMRAFAAFAPPEDAAKPELALRWFAAAGQPAFNLRPQEPARAIWLRFVSAPGLRSLRVVARGRCAAWADGAVLTVTATARREDGLTEMRFALSEATAGRSRVALRVEPVRGVFGADALAEPVAMECGAGELRAGDWCGQGLEHYSGRVWYRQTLPLTPEQAARAEWLELGGVAATAEVRVNGRCLANLISPPWRVGVRGVLRAGENRIEIRVANTLANFFHVGIPTPYAPREQTVSGLLGPVRLFLANPSSPLL